jgi:hypothetical protein
MLLGISKDEERQLICIRLHPENTGAQEYQADILQSHITYDDGGGKSPSTSPSASHGPKRVKSFRYPAAIQCALKVFTSIGGMAKS